MRRALVTGGAGFIGSGLVARLLEAGAEVTVLDSFDRLAHPDAERELAEEVRLVRGDLADPDAVARSLDRVEEVFHLGGVVGNGESLVNVRRCIESNATGTATLLEGVLARRDRVRRLVCASSMVVYGEGAYRCPDHGRITGVERSAEQLRERRWEPPCPECGRDLEAVPVVEGDPLRPASVYAISKRDTEELCLVLGAAYGLESVALRYLNTYGPGQALGNPYTGVAAIFASRVLAGRRPRVFEDGGQIRDLVHVEDVVRATDLAMSAPEAAGRAINVCTGRTIRVRDLARRICEAMGASVEPEVTGEFRAGDVRHCFADPATAERLLGFRAERRFEDSVAELAEWVARQRAADRGDAALADLRAAGLVG